MPACSFFLIKPDAIERGYLPHVLGWLDRTGLSPVRLQLARVTPAQLDEHYRAHLAWDGYPAMRAFLLSGPVVLGVCAGPAGWPPADVCAALRGVIGTFREPRDPNTIRGAYMIKGDPLYRNLIHGSDNPEEALREAELWFGPGGLSAV